MNFNYIFSNSKYINNKQVILNTDFINIINYLKLKVNNVMEIPKFDSNITFWTKSDNLQNFNSPNFNPPINKGYTHIELNIIPSFIIPILKKSILEIYRKSNCSYIYIYEHDGINLLTIFGFLPNIIIARREFIKIIENELYNFQYKINYL